MIGRLALVAVLAVACVAGEAYKPMYQNDYVPDKEFLLKQKRIYNILYHVTQPELKPELYKEGQEFKIEMGNYKNQDAVKDFMHRLEHGFLPHDAIFSLYYFDNVEQLQSVFRILYYAKDFDTFYKTALFCRNKLNHAIFGYAFYLAVMHRPDTQYMKLPPLYELLPHYFFNNELLEKAHHVKEFGKLEQKHSAGYDTYIIPYNYSNYYLSEEYDYEQRLNYFTEDIGLNTYYFFFRNEYPFFLTAEELQAPKNYRGEEYLYGHKLLLNRYFLERLSNDLGHIEDYNYNRPFYPGFKPTMTYPNGLPFPSRPSDSYFPKNKYHQIQEVEEYETRISQAVDSGMVFIKEGKPAKIYTPEGLNMLGNIIEGNADSCNEMYYGNVDMLARNILGFNSPPLTPYKLQPSALENMLTSLRDPAFYRLYKRLLHFYDKYKHNQKPYKPEEIQFPDLKIESVDIDKLITYFDYFDATISNGLAVSSEQEAEAYLIQARQYRLNHKPFNVKINIKAEKATKAAIRIFLGPKYTVHNNELDYKQHHDEFYEMDNFIYDLAAGENKIDRSCHDFFFIDHEPEPSEVFYKKLLKAIDGSEELKLQKRIFAFPERLLLPKGKPEGMPFQLFVFVSPVQGEPMTYTSRVFGEALMDNRPFGYPLDRPIREFDFHGPNFFFKDVFIYHQLERDPNVTY
jgi:hypothetical protein